jgi:hypothetical protein
MIHVFPITIPANTTYAARQKAVLSLLPGRITHAMIQFPAGHCGLTHIYINRGLTQLWPTNPESDFSADSETIDFEEDFLLDQGPYHLEAYAWNFDDTYDHTITLRISVGSIPHEKSLFDELKALFTSSGEA